MLSQQFLTFRKPAVRYTYVCAYKVNVYTMEPSYADRTTNADIDGRTYHVVTPSDVRCRLSMIVDSDDSDDN